MQITITIPDDTADTCLAYDPIQDPDPVVFLTNQLQEIADINVGMAKRRKKEFAIKAAGVVLIGAERDETISSMYTLLQNTQQGLLDQVAAKQLDIDAKKADIDAKQATIDSLTAEVAAKDAAVDVKK